MIRTPLRPLASILRARQQGQNPDAIEKENLRARHEAMRDGSRAMAEGRLLLLGIVFFVAFAGVAVRMGGGPNTCQPYRWGFGEDWVVENGDPVYRPKSCTGQPR